MQNRITELFTRKSGNILSVYFTAGFPNLNDTITIIEALEHSGVDMIEIGIPFSDPLADGPVIQNSSELAIKNGMTLKVLFEQIKEIRKTVSIPLVLMGYVNPVMQYGVEAFCKKSKEVGVDGIIIPDLPMQEYLDEYKGIFEANNLSNIFLITPQSSAERVKWIDDCSNGFIYMVSSASTTGKNTVLTDSATYFERIKSMNLKNPTIIGFGIADKTGFDTACKYASGAIIGSAFVKAMANSKDIKADVKAFVSKIISN